MENFLHAIQPWRVVSNKEDKLIFKGSNSSNYSVKLMYEVLNRSTSSAMPLVPFNMGFFAWKASWGTVLALDQLKIRGRPLANICYLCEKEETLDHLPLFDRRPS